MICMYNYNLYRWTLDELIPFCASFFFIGFFDKMQKSSASLQSSRANHSIFYGGDTVPSSRAPGRTSRWWCSRLIPVKMLRYAERMLSKKRPKWQSSKRLWCFCCLQALLDFDFSTTKLSMWTYMNLHFPMRPVCLWTANWSQVEVLHKLPILLYMAHMWSRYCRFNATRHTINAVYCNSCPFNRCSRTWHQWFKSRMPSPLLRHFCSSHWGKLNSTMLHWHPTSSYILPHPLKACSIYKMYIFI